jgi:hypothetical protein
MNGWKYLKRRERHISLFICAAAVTRCNKK